MQLVFRVAFQTNYMYIHVIDLEGYLIISCDSPLDTPLTIEAAKEDRVAAARLFLNRDPASLNDLS